ncbi:MAG: DedA family protein [Candidatus Moranbacteria bacterium]|nr:DedA family protein [Candidatus Moranbacteria bacterium]
MSISLVKILAMLLQFKYWILFPIVVIEGPIITVIVGLMVSLGSLNFLIAFPLIVVADVVGDCLYYAIGRYAGKRFLERWGRYIGIKISDLDKIENHYKQHSGKTLVIGKLSHAFGVAVLLGAGMAKMPISEFIWYNFIATVPKSLVLFLIGFYFGNFYNQINKYLDYTAIASLFIFIIFVAVYLFIRKTTKDLYKKI